MSEEPNLIKVATDSRPAAVAGAIAGMIREDKQVVVQAIGAGAVNQALKSLITARLYLEEDGLDLAFTASFAELEINGKERTAIRLDVLRRECRKDLPSTDAS